MAEESKQHSSSSSSSTKNVVVGLDAKWDACLDLSIRRVAYSSLSGALAGLLLLRSPTTRWASVAFGAGVGIGTAYTECSYIFDGSTPKLSAPQVSTVSSQEGQE